MLDLLIRCPIKLLESPKLRQWDMGEFPQVGKQSAPNKHGDSASQIRKQICLLSIARAKENWFAAKADDVMGTEQCSTDARSVQLLCIQGLKDHS